MTSVFLFISILLNIIALFFIVILYLRQSKLFEVEKKQRKMIEEMEDVISTYLAEMKEENESFIERITNAEKSKGKKKEKRKGDEGDLERLLPSEVEEKITFPIKGSKSQAVKAYQMGASGRLDEDDIEVLLPSFDDLESPTVDLTDKEVEMEIDQAEEVIEPKEKSLLEEVLHLQEQGLSFEEIAKKLHKGKTEIELLFKFRQNNQE